MTSTSRVVLMVGALGVFACGTEKVPVGASSGTSDLSPTAKSTVEIASQIHDLELQAAAQLYGDSTGQSEGAEDLRHTVMSSSIAVLRAVVNSDSANARAWYLLGDALSDRAYRGFGNWDAADQQAAVAALERAQALSSSDPALKARVDSALADNRKTLRAMPKA